MPYVLEVEFPGLPRMTNASGGSRNFWTVKGEGDRWKAAVVRMVRPQRPAKPLSRARLTLTRFSSVSPDPDGLVSGFKHVIDGLVMAGVLVNDRWENIEMPTYRWEQVPPRRGKIRVRVEEVVS